MPKGISVDEQDFLLEVLRVFAAHPAIASRFAIARAHSHFPISRDEILYETTDVQRRESTVRPVKTSELPEDSFVSQWSIETSHDGATMRPALLCCGEGPRGSFRPLLACCGDGLH